MPTTTTFPGLRQVGSRRTLVFCQPMCRSSYDGPTVDVLVAVPAGQLAENARCLACGDFLQPQYIAQCEDCGRLVYDDADGGRRHVERPEVGCFLIGPHGVEREG